MLWPAAGFTKGDLVGYYRRIAPVLVPHLTGKALTLGRWPGGVTGRGFAQTECRGRPGWLRTAELRLRSGETRRHCLVEDAASLVWVANLCTVELHTHQFAVDSPDEPHTVPFDLDPGPGAGLAELAGAALALKRLLDGLGLRSCVKTSGAAGLHVVLPLGEPTDAERTSSFAREVAARLATEQPDLVTDDIRPARRRDRVLVDWRQAEPRRLLVSPYSLRAADHPLVSAPVSWDEVAAIARRPDPSVFAFGPADVLRRIERRGDLFADALSMRQALPQLG